MTDFFKAINARNEKKISKFIPLLICHHNFNKSIIIAFIANSGDANMLQDDFVM
jgi:hypothetical protein